MPRDLGIEEVSIALSYARFVLQLTRRGAPTRRYDVAKFFDAVVSATVKSIKEQSSAFSKKASVCFSNVSLWFLPRSSFDV